MKTGPPTARKPEFQCGQFDLIVRSLQAQLPKNVAKKHSRLGSRCQHFGQSGHEIPHQPRGGRLSLTQRPSMTQLEKKSCRRIQFHHQQPTEPREKGRWQKPSGTGPDQHEISRVRFPGSEERRHLLTEWTMTFPVPKGSQMPSKPAARAHQAGPKVGGDLTCATGRPVDRRTLIWST